MIRLVFACVLVIASTIGVGAQSRLTKAQTAELMPALMEQVTRCWNMPVNALDNNYTPLKVTARLKPDGSLDGKPEIVAGTGKGWSKTAALSAVRAMVKCAPFKAFTKYPDAYSDWREFNATFDPRELFQ